MSMNGTNARGATMRLARPARIPVMRVGATTQRFFDEGEEHEATDWKNALLPPDDVPDSDPEAQFESFDKIPKRRNPILTVVAIGAFLLIGSAAWAMAFRLMPMDHPVRASVDRWMAGVKTSIAARLPPASPVQVPVSNSTLLAEPTGPLVVPITPAIPTAAPTTQASARLSATRDTPTADVVNVPVADVPVTKVPVAEVRPASERVPGETSHAVAARDLPRPGRSPALRGFVWSPSAKALVPIEPSLPSVPTTAPDPANEAPTERPAPLGNSEASVAPPAFDPGPSPAAAPAPLGAPIIP
ncbi:MAG: hypothetical protein H7X95_11795 [Deltaproteobacteria bacterium]|nr:hypothetical protein [Deltaproteobacteria bacterium]